MMTGCN